MADTYSFRPTTVVDALGFDGHPMTDALVKAAVACANATGGAFACTATNTDDETLYLSVMSAEGGASSGSKQCAVIGSNSDSAAWSA